MGQLRDDKPVIIIERSSGGLGGFLLGLAVGAVGALLLAPQSGEETREILRERGQRLRDDARARADEIGHRVEEGYERVKGRFEEGVESARRTFEDKRAGAKDALDAGRAAVHSARDELERRLADSKSEVAEVDEPDEDEAV